MKKFLITIFAVFYLGVSSGATVHFHYCMGKLTDWGLTHEKNSKCSNCGMKKTEAKQCCKDEHQILKIDKAQKASESSFLVKQLSVTVINLPLTSLPVHFLPVSEELPFSKAPPQIGKISTFLRNCTFRI